MQDYATLEQLVVLSNLESINALLIHQKISQSERIKELNQIAIAQMSSLIKKKANKTVKMKNLIIHILKDTNNEINSS
ncbi:MAG: hypothetical protein LBD03_09955 [Methanobrevibacter sp.]|jgi:hypothetical protein|nr:hypothetical protein [Candidatus Methanovirga procula]